VFKNAVELGFQAVKNLRVKLVFERHGEKDRFKSRRLGFEPNASCRVTERDLASAEQSTWSCRAGDFLG